MFLYKYMLYFIFIFTKIEFNTSLKIQIIKDVIKKYSPYSVNLKPNGFFCSSIKEKLNFLKAMNELGLMSSVSDINNKNNLRHYVIGNDVLFVVDCDCKHFENIFEKAEELNLFQAPYKWLLINSQSNTKLFEYMQNFSLLIDSQLIVVDINEANMAAFTYGLYKRRENHSMIIEDIGYWKNGIYEVNELRTISWRRKNLMGTLIKSSVVATNNDTNHHLIDRKHKHIDTFSKVNIVYMLQVIEFLNATVNYTIKKTWAGTSSNSSHVGGILGQILRKEIDITGTGMFQVAERVPKIDYVLMETPTNIKFVFRQPKLSYTTNVFTLPFDSIVWVSCIALVIIVALILYLTTRWERQIMQVKNTADDLNLGDVLFLSFGAVCQQGAHIVPSGTPGRIVTIFLFMSLMFLFTSYSANIVALLQTSSNSIQTLEDMLNSRIEIGAEDTVYNRYFFPLATEPIRKALYDKKIAPPGKTPNWFSLENGVKKMRNNFFAFHMEAPVGYFFVADTYYEDEKCGLQEIEFIQVPNPTMVVTKNCSFKELVKIGYAKVQENGLQQRELNFFYTKKPECISQGSSNIAVGIVDCHPAFMIFAIGISLAAIIFILELIVAYRFTMIELIEIKTTKPYPYRN